MGGGASLGGGAQGGGHALRAGCGAVPCSGDENPVRRIRGTVPPPGRVHVGWSLLSRTFFLWRFPCAAHCPLETPPSRQVLGTHAADRPPAVLPAAAASRQGHLPVCNLLQMRVDCLDLRQARGRGSTATSPSADATHGRRCLQQCGAFPRTSRQGHLHRSDTSSARELPDATTHGRRCLQQRGATQRAAWLERAVAAWCARLTACMCMCM